MPLRVVRVVARICVLLASAAIITVVSHVNMAVAGIGGIGGGGKGGGGGGRAHAGLSEETAAPAVQLAALSIIHLQGANSDRQVRGGDQGDGR